MEIFALTSQLPNQKEIINRSLQIDKIRSKFLRLPPLQPVSLNVNPNFIFPFPSRSPNWVFSERFPSKLCIHYLTCSGCSNIQVPLKDEKFRE